jgi:hypothetical protein
VTPTTERLDTLVLKHLHQHLIFIFIPRGHVGSSTSQGFIRRPGGLRQLSTPQPVAAAATTSAA